MSEELAAYQGPEMGAIMERVITTGDLGDLTPRERLSYYTHVCKSLRLNPLTRPFDYIELDGKLTLYATRRATDQLRKIDRISIVVQGREEIGDVYRVVAVATDPQGRTDEAEGVVSIVREGGEWRVNERTGKRYFAGNSKWERLRGEEMARARMKCETKAKRRATLSICGLGWMDESERDTLPRDTPVGLVDLDTGEILEPGVQVGNGRASSPPPREGEHMTAPQHRAIEALIAKAGLDREDFKTWLAAERLILPGGHLTELSKKVASSIIDRWDDVLCRYQDWMMRQETKEEGEYHDIGAGDGDVR